MRITRRNTLVVLLVLVAAGGIAGTGAFSQVSADRSVDVSTAGDSNANVQFQVNTADHPSLSSSGNTVNFNFDNVNLDATTTYNDALNVSLNSAQSDSYDVTVSNEPAGVNVSFSGSNTVTNVGSGQTVSADITLNTTGDTSTSAADVDGNIEFTVESN
jgi:hypothetical protein